MRRVTHIVGKSSALAGFCFKYMGKNQIYGILLRSGLIIRQRRMIMFGSSFPQEDCKNP